MNCSAVFEEIKVHHNITYTLRNEQASILDKLAARENVFAVLPTGFGKSAIYSILPLILQQVKQQSAPGLT